MNPFEQKIGAYLHKDGTCTFTVWAPLKREVKLKIEDQASEVHTMHCDPQGYWQVSLPERSEGDKYLYILDGALERPDPASVYQPDGIHGPSQVISRNFEWSDTHWKGLPMEDLIIYEIHVGTFSPEGTFEGVISKLPYLKELGITAIEIMPVGAFPGERNWGYDVAYPFAVQSTYGKPANLKALVDAAHNAGIAVIMDVIYNHVGPDGNYFKDYAPYFTDNYKTPWGEALNYDGPYSAGVRNYLLQNALMWLDEYHIDGLRMDAVHAIWDNSAYHIMEELKDHVRLLEQTLGRKKLLIAEFDLNNPRYISPKEKGGFGLDGQWIDEFHHALRSLLTGEREGYYEDFGTIQHLERAFRDTYVYNGVYSEHRKKIFGAPLNDHDYSQFVVFSQNHDHIGNRPLGDRLSKKVSFEHLKIAAAAVLLSPYVPFIFMGEEYAEESPFLFFAHHEDPELIQKVSEGRKQEFSYFNFKEDFPEPHSDEVFVDSKLSWDTQSAHRKAMLAYYKQLISFRKTHAAMRTTKRENVKVYASKGMVLVFERMAPTGSLVVAINFSNDPGKLPQEIFGNYTKLLDSSDTKWAGPQTASLGKVAIGEATVIHPISALVLEKDLGTATARIDESNFINPLSAFLF